MSVIKENGGGMLYIPESRSMTLLASHTFTWSSVPLNAH